MTHTTEQERAQDLAEKHGATSYRNRADTQNPAYGFTPIQLAALIAEVEQAARHAPAVPVPQEVEKLRAELAEETEATDNWRRLALQFDNHRMQALWHLRAVVNADNSTLEAKVAEDFLKAPPLDGEAVLAQRIAALAAAPHPPETEPVQMQMPEPVAYQWLETDNFRTSGKSLNGSYWRKLYTEHQVSTILAQHGIKTK